MQIKHYDVLRELFGSDRAGGKDLILIKLDAINWKRKGKRKRTALI